MLLATKKMQIKSTMRYHYTQIKMAKMKNNKSSVAEATEVLELSYIIGGNVKWNSHSEKQFYSFL